MRLKKIEASVNAGVHFFLFNELAARGCGNPFFNGGKKPLLIVEVTRDDVLHELVRIAALFGPFIRELGLQVGTEMHFHRFRVRESLSAGQEGFIPFPLARAYVLAIGRRVLCGR